MIVSIQYLRALAVILVLLIHISDKSGQYGTGIFDFRDGRFGVDIFFVISGFVMYYVTLGEKSGLSTIWVFLKHRIIRIIPLYWFLTFIALIVYIVLPISTYHGGEISIVKSFFLFPIDFPKEKYLIPIAWTLSYEFYFYLLFSITLLFSRHRGMIATSILLSLVSVGCYLQLSHDHVLLRFLTNSLLLEFFYGILVVHLYQKIHTHKILFSIIFFILFTLSYTLYSMDFRTGYRGIDLGIPAIFLVLSFIMIETQIKRYLFNPMIHIGAASFSLYLIHPFVLTFFSLVYKRIGIHSELSEWVFILIMFAGSLVIGSLTYYFIEKNMTKYFRSKA